MNEDLRVHRRHASRTPHVSLSRASAPIIISARTLTIPSLTTEGASILPTERLAAHALKALFGGLGIAQPSFELAWKGNAEKIFERHGAPARRHGRRDTEHAFSHGGMTKVGAVSALSFDMMTCHICAMSGERINRPYAGKKAEDRRRVRREKFIAAGLELFGTEGYAGTTVKALCAEAGLTERYFYESFENREELFLAVATTCVTGLFGSLTLERARTRDRREAMEAMLRAFFEWFREDPRRIRIQLIEPPVISPLTQKLYTEIVRLFEGLVRELAREWFGFRASDPRAEVELLGRMLVGGLIELVKGWADEDFERPIEDYVRTALFPLDAIAQMSAER